MKPYGDICENLKVSSFQDLSHSGHTDPYWAWAERTNYKDYALQKPVGQGDLVAVAIECKTSVEDFASLFKASIWVSLASAYDPSISKLHLDKLRFCTALVERSMLPFLSLFVERFELGVAVESSKLQRVPLGAFANGKVAIGLIDDSIGFAHSDLLSQDPSTFSRVGVLWNQDRTKADCQGLPDSWRRPSEFDYGFELEGVGVTPQKKLVAFYPRNQRSQTHGSHVAALAAGGVDHNADVLGPGTPRQVRTDHASKMPIVAVQFPKTTAQDTSGGAMNVQVLDAVHFVLNRVKSATKVAINLSYGTFAGPHDGTSILEQALDELVTVLDGRVAIVVPAGNQYESRCHAIVNLQKPGSKKNLEWQILPDGGTPCFMEVWLPPNGEKSVEIQLASPSGQNSPFLKAGQSWTAPDFIAGIEFQPKVANGISGTMILIVVSPTRPSGVTAIAAPHGVWQVTLRALKKVTGIHAYVERNETFSATRIMGRQSFLLDDSYEKFGKKPGLPGDTQQSSVKRQGAFNTIATGSKLFVAGGYVGKTNTVAYYSGSGPKRLNVTGGPTVVAVSDASRELSGLRSASAFGSGINRANGTSVAAAQLTRWIANWYQTQTDLGGNTQHKQLLAALTASSIPLKQTPDYGQPAPTNPTIPFRDGMGRVT